MPNKTLDLRGNSVTKIRIKTMNSLFSHRFILTIYVPFICLVFFGSSVVFAEVISARKADSQTMEAVDDQSFLGLEMLGGLSVSDPPGIILAAIEQYLLTLQQSDSLPTDLWNEVYMPLGALWGEQIAYSYGWEWEKVWLDKHQGEFVFAIVSPNQSMVIYPFKHLYECIESGKTVSVSQVYRAIGENKELLKFPEGSYYEILSNLALLVMQDKQR